MRVHADRTRAAHPDTECAVTIAHMVTHTIYTYSLRSIKTALFIES